LGIGVGRVRAAIVPRGWPNIPASMPETTLPAAAAPPDLSGHTPMMQRCLHLERTAAFPESYAGSYA
jgi:hypothetical protein